MNKINRHLRYLLGYYVKGDHGLIFNVIKAQESVDIVSNIISHVDYDESYIISCYSLESVIFVRKNNLLFIGQGYTLKFGRITYIKYLRIITINKQGTYNRIILIQIQIKYDRINLTQSIIMCTSMTSQFVQFVLDHYVALRRHITGIHSGAL